MDGADLTTSRTDAALSGDLLDLVKKDRLLDLSDDLLPFLEAQSEPLRAGNPLRSRNSVKTVNALSPLSKVVSTVVRISMAAPIPKNSP